MKKKKRQMEQGRETVPDADTTWGNRNSNNPVTLDRYWQNLMRSCI